MIPFSFLIGLLYEIVPRWIILCTSTVVLAALMNFQEPLSTKSWFVSSIASRAAFFAIFNNPLVNDYVVKRLRGFAGVTVEVCGYIIG